MKKFKFPLEAVLKLKEFNEYKIKLELGKINHHIRDRETKIQNLKLNISTLQDMEEKCLREGTPSSTAQLYTQLVLTARSHIKLEQKKLEDAKAAYRKKQEELAKAKGEVKIFNNLKQKQLEQFKKEQNKKIESDLQDALIGRNLIHDGKDL